MRYHAKLVVKLAFIFVGILFLLCVWMHGKESKITEPEGEKITVEDVAILLEALEKPVDLDTGGSSSFLTYGQYMEIYRQLGGEGLALPDYAERYGTGHEMLKKDWYEAYRLLLAHYDTPASIWETTVFVLKVDSEAKEAYTEAGALKGSYAYCSGLFEENVFQEMRVYVKGEKLLTIIEILPQEHYLGNVWVMENSGGVLECFYQDISFAVQAELGVERESVADLAFREGRIIKARQKKEKVHGKLLRVSDEEIEIEGPSVYPIAEDMKVYKLYGSLESLGKEDLKIGYADTDYVIEKGEVCACLVSRREDADSIRVLLKNTGKNSDYHEVVELVIGKETIKLKKEDFKVGERRQYRSDNLTDKIVINMEGSRREDNAYRGTLECYRAADGLVLINELPLEEYLYAVVPSEMPASYPAEALKAQAICARTYAYLSILHAGIPNLGAHLDDTVSYQVYHNIKENSATTTAVKETDGILLSYQGEPAQNYYYSTSCGVGTDSHVWGRGEGEGFPYLRAERICLDDRVDSGNTEGVCPEDLQDEGNFRRFITSVQEDDLEKEEPWYRWQYTVGIKNAETLLQRIKERYRANPQCVLTQTKDGYYAAEEIDGLSKIIDLSVTKRGVGGVADELVIKTENKTVKILSEYNIRYVLCDGESEVVRQDGSAAVPMSLLPSGFFIVETRKIKDYVVGYTLIGGGYGHGVGMSQNGAKALGKKGASYDKILALFFSGCELAQIGDL